MADKNKKKLYKTSFFICSSFIFGPLGSLISWLILKLLRNKKDKNRKSEEQTMQNLETLKNKDVENLNNKEKNIINKLNNQKLAELYKNILAELNPQLLEQSKNIVEIKNPNLKTIALSKQVLPPSKNITNNITNSSNNSLLAEIIKVKKNLRKTEPKPRDFPEIGPVPSSKTNLSNWQKEQIKALNEELNLGEKENKNTRDIEENTK